MYIYELPYLPRRNLCYMLDQNDKWEELGVVHMKYDRITLDSLKKIVYKGGSPSQELLTLWGHQNHTVTELFALLAYMKMYQGMTVIKEFVDKRYHCLIKQEPERLESLIEPLNIDNNGNCDDVKVRREQKVTKENDVENNHLKPKQQKQKTLSVSEFSSVAESARGIPSIPYEELQKSTNNWDENSVLGRGGFGKVYKGTWKCTAVAIKRLEAKDSNEQIKQSITELYCLNSYRHDNILPLYGYSIGGPLPCLIYQYMPGGSLDLRLRIRDPLKILDCMTRMNIAIGSARGLQFLHTNMIKDKPLVHGDIKSANILLDSKDEPRIGDFGLAREGPQSQYTYIKLSRIQGTRPYLPEEFLRGNKFSTKVDTYSFGVVLFEIATALAPYSERREDKFLKDHIVNYEGDIMDLKDKRVEGFDDYFKGMLEIGKMCVRQQAKARPEMVNVLILLENVRDKKPFN